MSSGLVNIDNLFSEHTGANLNNTYDFNNSSNQNSRPIGSGNSTPFDF